jgi:hypothetical protein
MKPITASKALDTFFLEARCKLLDVAAILDRLDRGEGDVSQEPRLKNIRKAIEVLSGPGPGRAEQIQMIFSLPYDPNWPRPEPK